MGFFCIIDWVTNIFLVILILLIKVINDLKKFLISLLIFLNVLLKLLFVPFEDKILRKFKLFFFFKENVNPSHVRLKTLLIYRDTFCPCFYTTEEISIKLFLFVIFTLYLRVDVLTLINIYITSNSTYIDWNLCNKIWVVYHENGFNVSPSDKFIKKIEIFFFILESILYWAQFILT